MVGALDLFPLSKQIDISWLLLLKRLRRLWQSHGNEWLSLDCGLYIISPNKQNQASLEKLIPDLRHKMYKISPEYLVMQNPRKLSKTEEVLSQTTPGSNRRGSHGLQMKKLPIEVTLSPQRIKTHKDVYVLKFVICYFKSQVVRH